MLCLKAFRLTSTCNDNNNDNDYVMISAELWIMWISKNRNLRKQLAFRDATGGFPRNGVWQTMNQIPTNQRHFPDLISNTWSVWNFCACFSDVILRGNHRWRRKMSAVFRFVNVLSPCASTSPSRLAPSFSFAPFISCACYVHRSQEIAFRFQWTFNLHAFIVPVGSNRSRRSETKGSLGDRLYTNAKYLQTGPCADQQRNW